MKSFLPIVTLGLLACFVGLSTVAPDSSQAGPETVRVWTAEEAVAFAIAGNPDSTIARKRIEEARAAAIVTRRDRLSLDQRLRRIRANQHPDVLLRQYSQSRYF